MKKKGFFTFCICTNRKAKEAEIKMASLPLISSAGAEDDENHLLSLLERAKTAGLAHEREQALLAGRSAIARSTAEDDNFDAESTTSPAALEWSRHALSGALDVTESKECRRCVWEVFLDRK